MVDYYYLLITIEMCKEACVLSPVVQHVMLKAGWLQAVLLDTFAYTFLKSIFKVIMPSKSPKRNKI